MSSVFRLKLQEAWVAVRWIDRLVFSFIRLGMKPLDVLVFVGVLPLQEAHTRSKVGSCFEIIAYPDSWESKGRGSCNPARRGCGSIKAHATSAINASSSSTPSSSSSAASSCLFTLDQWKALVGLFGTLKLSNERLSGKFDSTS